MKVEVRCCCKPDVLLGWIEMPKQPREDTYVFPIGDGVYMHLTLAGFSPDSDIDNSYLAFKSGHHTVEELKQIRKFEPA